MLMVTIVMAYTNLRCIFLQKRLFVNRAVLCCRKQKIDEDSNFFYREAAFLNPTFTPKKFFHRNFGLFTRVRFCKSLIFNICLVSRRNIYVL